MTNLCATAWVLMVWWGSNPPAVIYTETRALCEAAGTAMKASQRPKVFYVCTQVRLTAPSLTPAEPPSE